jgi:NADPH:quinone reductase-like Zn-dependent oxidoreductase
VFAASRLAAKLDVLRSHVGDLGGNLIGIDTSTTALENVATSKDVIVDNVGASVLAGNIVACRVGGRIVQVGRLGGRTAEIDLDEVARKRIILIGVTFRTRAEDDVAEIVRRATTDVGDRMVVLRPRIDGPIPEPASPMQWPTSPAMGMSASW